MEASPSTDIAALWRNVKWHPERDRVVLWDITYKCNLACKHCYNEEFRGDHAGMFLPLRKSLGVVDGLARDGFEKLNLLGGEPAVVPFVAHIVERDLKLGIDVSIATNGLLLKGQLAEQFAELGFSRFEFSLGSLSEETAAAVRGRGVLQRVLRNVRSFANLLARRGVPNRTAVNLSVTGLGPRGSHMRDVTEFTQALRNCLSALSRTNPVLLQRAIRCVLVCCAR